MNALNVIFSVIFHVVYSDRCTIDDRRPEYFLVAPCHRSTLKLISEIDNTTLKECESLTTSKRGMSFNYSPHRGVNMTTTNGKVLKKCMVFMCSEIENSTSLVFDSRFNYYSKYANPIPPPNSTCINGVGMFVYHSRNSNYTDARDACEDLGAKLADVTSEARTNELSKNLGLLPVKLQEIYVGLDNLNGSYVKSDGIQLSCSRYRAWAPGHPKQRLSKSGCVTLDQNNLWRAVDCNKKLPFLCEILPGGWSNFYDYYEYEQLCVDVFMEETD